MTGANPYYDVPIKCMIKSAKWNIAAMEKVLADRSRVYETLGTADMTNMDENYKKYNKMVESAKQFVQAVKDGRRPQMNFDDYSNPVLQEVLEAGQSQ